MSITLEDADVRAFVRVLTHLFGAHVQSDVAALKELITHQLSEIKMSIEDAKTKAAADSAKLDDLVTEVHSLKDRVTAADAGKDAALAAANSAKDTATAALAAAQDEIEALKAAAQAVPADTTELEAALDSLGTKLDEAKAEVAAIDAAPAPAPADPNAPQGTEQPLEQA
jgi:chromosome segregation ATPase